MRRPPSPFERYVSELHRLVLSLARRETAQAKYQTKFAVNQAAYRTKRDKAEREALERSKS